MVGWFTEYRDVLAGISGIATAIGLFATSAALVMAAIQTREQRRVTQANAVYQVQRDAREFAWQLLNDPTLATAVYGRPPDKSGAAIATVINFYSAVFQMKYHRVLDERLWEAFADDFSRLLASEPARKQWEKSQGSFDPYFVRDILKRTKRNTAGKSHGPQE